MLNILNKDEIFETGHAKRYVTFFFALSLSFTDLNHRRRTNLWTFLPPILFSSPQILLQIAIPIYPPIIHWLPRHSSQVFQLGPSLFRVDIRAVRSSRGRFGTFYPSHDWQCGFHCSCKPLRRRSRHARHELPPDSPSTSTDVSRPETETEDDGDVDMDRTQDNGRIDSDVASALASPSPERQMRNATNAARQHTAQRAVGIVSDEPTAVPPTLQVGGLDSGVEVGVGVVNGIVSLEQNDDFAMEAPPGAPGVMGEAPTPRILDLTVGAGTNERRRRNTIAVDAPDVSPRAAVVNLPLMASTAVRPQPTQGADLSHQWNATIRTQPADGAVGIINASDAITIPATGSPVEITASAMNTTPTKSEGEKASE